jgi:hypothetical protein
VVVLSCCFCLKQLLNPSLQPCNRVDETSLQVFLLSYYVRQKYVLWTSPHLVGGNHGGIEAYCPMDPKGSLLIMWTLVFSPLRLAW